MILTASSLVMRASSIGYRTYLSSKIGTAGMGLYQLVMSVFILAITVSTSGISLAVTRIVTDTITKGRRLKQNGQFASVLSSRFC